MNVLSLFDGMACGRLALQHANIPVENYFASEIDKYAIKIAQKNFHDIIQLGDVNNWRNWNLPKIDLLIGGSPCQGFSLAGKQLAFSDSRSRLFFVFVDILNFIKSNNPSILFLLENVRMKKEYEQVISDALGINPQLIDSGIVSAQQRKRLYWSNIGTINDSAGHLKTNFLLPKNKNLKLIDIIENKTQNIEAVEISKQKRRGEHILESAFTGKSSVLTSFQYNSMVRIFPVDISFYLDDDNIQKAYKYKEARTFKTGNSSGKMPFPNKLHWKSLCLTTSNGTSRLVNFVFDGFGVRRLTPIEWERLQTLPDNYTEGVSNTQRYKMIGNGWTIDVIAHIFSFIKG